ncbi:hypothetical protein TDB9533_04242 [Thalassocella blandensis]|nr:hypothetical protein TDB9533_04242 [Thalassocella blandensis]
MFWRVLVCLALGGLMLTVNADEELQSGSQIVSSVEISPEKLTLYVGHFVHVIAIVKDQHGSLVLGKPVVWSSADPDKVTVSNEGFVVVNAEVTTRLTATVDGKSASITVTVVPSPELVEAG